MRDPALWWVTGTPGTEGAGKSAIFCKKNTQTPDGTALASLGCSTTSNPLSRSAQMWREIRKRINVNFLDKKLYARAQKQPFGGKIELHLRAMLIT